MKVLHDETEIMVLVARYKKILIMGAGKMCQRLFLTTFLPIKNSIDAIIVSNTENNPSSIHDIKVVALSEQTISRDLPIIVAIADKDLTGIAETLKENGYRHVYFLTRSFIGKLVYEMPRYFYSSHSRTLLRYEVQVAEHCNLNCKGCYHFSPLAKEEYLDIEQYKRDTARLSELFDSEVEWVHLMGGEPLLNPCLPEIMEITRKAFRYGHIMVVTNGLLLPKMSEEFWQTCHDYDIEICPTKYPIHFDYDSMAEIAKKYQVKYRYFNEGSVIKTLDRFPLSVEGIEVPEINFAHCDGANNCITLRDGKLYTCVFPAHAHHLIEYFDLPIRVSERDGVDIYKAKDADEIMEGLARAIPFCRYCKVNELVHGIPFAISRKDITEWIDSTNK